MRIASVLLDAEFAQVEQNLEHCRQLVMTAAQQGAQLVLLPEFFTSAIGFDRKMLDVAAADSVVHEYLCDLASKHRVIVAGSYISLSNGDAYNKFELVFPDGESFSHKKDIPTQFENCYYTDGDCGNVLETPIGRIGVALCWEQLRTETVRRMSGKVDLILAGSCWWDLPLDAPPEREALRRYNQKLAHETPLVFSRLVGAPLVHAAHCGQVSAWRFPNEELRQTRRLVGAAQIVTPSGVTERGFGRGEGFVIADVNFGAYEPAESLPERYWIPELPESYINAWRTVNPVAREYYRDVTRGYYAMYNTAGK